MVILSWSIPAWAGKPLSSRLCMPSTSVHPRVGGETIVDQSGDEAFEGPSPRGRGNLLEKPVQVSR